jgi:hypothetical protein
MRELFIHIGTHKTGTTSIQHFLRSNADKLLGNGVYVPAAGTLNELSGHHNIAWELCGDERFLPEKGKLEDLILELGHTTARRAVVSSEDLECLLAHPARLADMHNRLRKAGWEPRYVVFFRNAPDYALSLYHELRKHEFNRSFASFFLEICRTGSFCHRQWLFRFDRVTFCRDWCAATDSRSLSVFSYDRCAWQSGLVPSFLSVLSIHDPILLHAAQKAERLNVGEDPASLYLRSLANFLAIKFVNPGPLSLDQDLTGAI